MFFNMVAYIKLSLIYQGFKCYNNNCRQCNSSFFFNNYFSFFLTIFTFVILSLGCNKKTACRLMLNTLIHFFLNF